MSVNEWVGVCVGISTLLTTLLLALRWVIKSYLSELKQNGGSSIKDSVIRLELQSSRLEKRVDDLFILISKS
jgi:hypothetical protein